MTDLRNPREVFVGREAEMTRLTEIVRRTRDGVGSTALVMGEAGMGKTRILRELTRVADAAGVKVAWGHAWADEGAPALWPWIQVIRAAIGAPAAVGREVDVGPGAAVLADAVPGIVDHLAPFEVLEAPPAHAEFYLRDAVVRLLSALAASQPLLVLLDDLHWADVASSRLAVALADHIGGASSGRLSLVASSRVNEAPPLVTDLSGAVTAFVLDGLSSVDCGHLADHAFGRALGRGELEALHASTGGVPLFVDAALRQGIGSAGGGLATGLEAVSTLSDACRELLEAASVLGRSFDIDTLANVVDETPAAVRADLAGAVHAGTISPVTAEGAGAETTGGFDPSPPRRFEFRHALVADEFYERLEPARRADLHLACAGAMTSDWEVDRWVTDRARHLLAALPVGDPIAAARAASDAARAARDRHAHDDAAQWYRRAYEVHPVDDGERCDLLIAHNVALIHGSGVAEAADGFAAAAALAEALGDSHRHLEALVGLTEARYRAPGLDVDDHTRLLLTRVADEVVGDVRLRAAAAEQLARLETFIGETQHALRYAEGAIDAAAAARDSAAAATAARAMRWATVGPTPMEAKRKASASLLMSGAHIHPEARWDAHQWMMLDAMEAGDRAAMDAEFAACRRVADDLGEPFVTSLTHVWEAGVSMMQGRFDDADAAIAAALDLMERAGVDPAGVYSQMAVLARDRGEIDGLDELLVGVADAVPESSSTYRAALALVYADQRRDDAARSELDRIGAGGFDQVAVNGVWLTTLALCAEACSVLDHRDAAAEILPLLVPYADRSVVSGGGPYLYLGAVTHHLGSLSTTAGQPERALAWLDRADRIHDSLGADAWSTRTTFERGRALTRLGGASAGPGRRQLEAAATAAERLGMRTLAERARALPARPTLPGGTFAPAGDRWHIAFRDDGFSLPDSKGLRCLHHLLGRAGEDVSAASLVADVLGEEVVSPERARVNVTRQIRAAIGRIADHDSELAQHLTTAVNTGHACRYEPAVAAPEWALDRSAG